METENFEDINEKIIAVKFRAGTPQKFIDFLIRKKQDFYIRQTSESTEIVCNYIKNMFSHSDYFPKNKLYVFSMVKKDALNWLETKPQVILPPKHNVSVFNLDYDDSYGTITGTDINNAYWSIALNKGIISENTYNHGLDTDSKALRLASLSVLGTSKEYYQFVNGEMSKKQTMKQENSDLRKVYKYIRYHCYQMMYELSLMLKDDFDCWKTDCIYYRESEENIKMVQDFFKSKNLKFKQLTV